MMSEGVTIDWNAVIDHLIQSVTTVAVAGVPAYFAFRVAMRKLDANTMETVKGKNAAIAAARTGTANADRLGSVQEAIDKKPATDTTVNVETVNVEMPSSVQ